MFILLYEITKKNQPMKIIHYEMYDPLKPLDNI